MAEPSAKARALAEEIKDLPPPEKLRLAAGLLEQKQPQLALSIARGVVNELSAALLLAEAPNG